MLTHTLSRKTPYDVTWTPVTTLYDVYVQGCRYFYVVQSDQTDHDATWEITVFDNKMNYLFTHRGEYYGKADECHKNVRDGIWELCAIKTLASCSGTPFPVS
jgi:hypothetical protein